MTTVPAYYAYNGGQLPTERRGTFFDYVRGLSLLIWFVLMLGGFWYQSDWFATIESTTRDKFFVFFRVGFSVAIVGHLTLGWNHFFNNPFVIPSGRDLRAALLATFFFLMLVLSPVSIVPMRSAQYAIVTWMTFCLCYSAWLSDYEVLRRMVVWAGILMLAFLVIVLFKHGFSYGKVGGINRNRFASAAFSAIVYISISRSQRKWLFFLVGIALIFLVNSRGSILGISSLVGIYLAVTKGLKRAMLFGFVGLLAIIVIDILPIGGERTSIITDKVLQLNRADRGLESGLSGRTQYWKRGMKTFSRKPFFGHGFRSRTNINEDALGAHSGYINLLQDAGFVGAGLVLSAFFFDAVKRFQILRLLKNLYPQGNMPPDIQDSFHLNALALSLYVMNIGYLMIEPLYFHLGHPFTIMFFFFSCSPLYTPRAEQQVAAHRHALVMARVTPQAVS